MARMTWEQKLAKQEEKRAQREAEQQAFEAQQRAEKIARFQRRVERERQQVTIEKTWDVMKLGETVTSPLFGKQEQVEVLYTAIETVSDARRNYERELEYMQQRVARAQAELAEGYSYTSLPLQNCDDANAAHATWVTALKLAQAIVRSVGCVYVPALYGKSYHEQRALRLRYTVMRIPALADSPERFWLVDVNGDVPAEIKATGHDGSYETSEAAWMAFMALVNEW